MQQICRRHRGDIARCNTGEDGRLAHFLDQIVGCRVGAEPHIDAGAQIIAEILHDLSVARKWRWAMGDRRAGVGNQCQIRLGPPAHP